MTITTITTTTAIAEAQSYGLDIDVDHADLTTIGKTAIMLRHMNAVTRALIVAEMNDGWTLAQAAERVPVA